MKPLCTFILLNYQRPNACRELIRTIKFQKFDHRILLLDNSRKGLDVKVDQRVHIPWNAGCLIRVLFIPYVESQYVCFIDDDLALKGPHSLGKIITIFNRVKAPIVGGWGALANEDGYEGLYFSRNNYYKAIKGRFMLFSRELAEKIPLASPLMRKGPSITRFHDDLYLSLYASNGKDVLYADQKVRDELTETKYDKETQALSMRGEHLGERSLFCKRYFEYIRK